MHGQIPARSTPGDQGAQGMGWHPCHGGSGSLVLASHAGTGWGPWSLLLRSGHTGPTALVGRQRTPASSKVTRSACPADGRSGPSSPPRPSSCPHTSQSGGDSLASSSWHTIRWRRPHGDRGTRGVEERGGEPRRYKAYLGTAESPAMFTDTMMGEIELLSWAVTERCNLAETHYPASYF